MDTKYIIETTDSREATLMMNAKRMANVISEIRDWRSQIYNGKAYGEIKYLYKGKLYDEYEFQKITIPEEDRDEHGFLKEGLVQHVYLEKDVEYKLDSIINCVDDLIYHNYE